MGAILTYSSLAPILLIISIVIYLKTKKSRLFIISSIYCLSVLFSFPFNNYLSNFLGKSESNISNRISSLNTFLENDKKVDESLNQRIAFYTQSINTIIRNPIFGVGIGNWKLKSIDTNKENITGYIVPYHVHNDYLEIGSEIGLVGLAIYLTILLFAFKDVIIKFLKIIFTKSKTGKNYIEYIVISLFAYTYFIDSNINFPFHRPIVLINLIILLAYLNTTKQLNLNEK